ncbi:MAG: DinB family protein [bacterium]|nr:DinB family protein [bacterium]
MMDIVSTVKALLETTPVRWQSLVAVLPENLLKRQPAAGEWSALECLEHLIDFDRNAVPPRFQAFFTGAAFPAFSPATATISFTADVSSEYLAQQFDALRRENLRLLDQITASDLEREAVHPQLGLVTLSQMLHQWGGHDLMHLRQAEQALMQPFIEGCGVWQVFFQQHLVQPNKT